MHLNQAMASLFNIVSLDNGENIHYSWSHSLLIVAACSVFSRQADAKAERGHREALSCPQSHGVCLQGERVKLIGESLILLFVRPRGVALLLFLMHISWYLKKHLDRSSESLMEETGPVVKNVELSWELTKTFGVKILRHQNTDGAEYPLTFKNNLPYTGSLEFNRALSVLVHKQWW